MLVPHVGVEPRESMTIHMDAEQALRLHLGVAKNRSVPFSFAPRT